MFPHSGVHQVPCVTEEDFETTEGESEDLYDKLMEMSGWTVTNKEKENMSLSPLQRVFPENYDTREGEGQILSPEGSGRRLQQSE